MGAIEDLFAQATTPSQAPSSTAQQLLLVQSLIQQQQRNRTKGGGKGGGGGGGGGGQRDPVTGRLIIKPRPVPRGYKPPLDHWHGAVMQPAAINSLQSGGHIGRAIAAHAVSTYRSYQSQAHIYASGVRPAAPPGSSYHQQGLAMDNPWIRTNPAAMRWMKHNGWNSGASFGDPNHWTYRVTG